MEFNPHTPLAGERLQPLGHLSVLIHVLNVLLLSRSRLLCNLGERLVAALRILLRLQPGPALPAPGVRCNAAHPLSHSQWAAKYNIIIGHKKTCSEQVF
tara:strand:+ start:7654 stop:7950 length:297 start_codon:yes stop_codon:yes gene_type:complete